MRYDVDGLHRATATGLAAAYEPGDYKQLRAEIRAGKPLADRVPAPPPALPAERVGRRNPDNVLVGALQPGPDPDRFTAPVRVDQLHPHFFEHPMEHVPGVLMLEAFRQMSLAAVGERHGLPAAGTVVLDSSTRFPGFAELELPLHCEARVGQPGDPRDGHVTVPLRLTLRQPGADDVAIGRMTLRCPAS